MTFRLLGLPEELRLAIEQADGKPTEEARVVYEAAVTEAVNQATTQVNQALREVQGIIGPHGSITRLQAGSIRVSIGEGIGVYGDGVFKTNIQPNGTLVIGSDIETPATTTEIFFVEDTVYNNEEFKAGDFLIGDNSASNVKYDAVEGRLQFRNGSTVQAYMDTDGSIKAGGGDVTIDAGGIWITNQEGAFGFKDTNGVRYNLYILSDGDDNLVIKNKVGGKVIRLETDTAAADPLQLSWSEDGTVTNASKLTLETGSDGGNIHLGAGVQIWAGKDGTGTVFNEDSYDIDFRVEGATNPGVFVVNAGEDRVELQNGTTAVHILNPTGKTYFNEPNHDIDTVFEGTTDANLLLIDAGLDGVGMGGAAESGYKLKVHGDVNLASGNTYDINGSPHTHTSKQLLFAHGISQTVPASSTRFMAFELSTGLITGAFNIKVMEACTISKLRIGTNGAQPASGNCVIDLMVNNATSAITATIPAGGGAGEYSDLTHSVSLAAGDFIGIRFTNNATAATGAIIASGALLEFTAT